MRTINSPSVVLLSTSRNLPPLLDEQARGRQWTVLCSATVSQGLRLIRSARPGVAVVYVPSASHAADSAGLITAIRRHARTTLIAVSPRYEEEIERAVRTAAVHCYLAGDQCEQLPQILCEAINARASPVARALSPPGCGRVV